MIPVSAYGFESGSGLRRLPTGRGGYLNERTPTHRHQGIDLGISIGTPVFAAMGGKVTHAKDVWERGFTGYGRHVVIENQDGTFSLYAHLDAVDVAPGEVVHVGKKIGTVGNTLFTRDDKEGLFKKSGPHLHFETSRTPYPKGSEAARIDPIEWLRHAETWKPGADEPFYTPDDGNVPDDSEPLIPDDSELLSDMEAVHSRLQRRDTTPGNFVALGAIFIGLLWLRRGAD